MTVPSVIVTAAKKRRGPSALSASIGRREWVTTTCMKPFIHRIRWPYHGFQAEGASSSVADGRSHTR